MTSNVNFIKKKKLKDQILYTIFVIMFYIF